MQRETVVYVPGGWKGLASQQYTKDLKKRQKQGWQLVSCTESGKNWVGQGILTAIYEKPGIAPMTPMIADHLALLLPMLSSEERIHFEADVQAVINQWLARKAQR
jgi:hypothetical protein